MKLILRLLFLSLLLSQSVLTLAQVQISGKVTDADTEEALPFTNVFVEGTTIGTTTDIDGNYSLKIEKFKSGQKLAVQMLGYEAQKKNIGPAPVQVIDFKMKGSSAQIDEVVILAGENPANEIVRRIARNKDKNNRTSLDAFQVESYSKVEMDIDNIDSTMRKKKIFKPFSFVFDNIDSTSDETAFLPMFMQETVADVFYSKSVGQEKEVPRARRVSGIKNESVLELIGQMHQKYSIYDNWISILDKPFAGPFMEGALGFYEYYIQDSTWIKGRWCYKLKFKPRRKQEATFYGDFWVDMKTYAVVRLNARMVPDANVNWVDRIIMYHEADNQRSDSMWLPVKDKIVIDFVATKKGVGVIGRKTTSFKDYQIGNTQKASKGLATNLELLDPATLEMSDTFWNSARHEQLTKNEAAVYQMIDSIKNVPIFKTYVDVLHTIFMGFKRFGPIEVGPYFRMYSFNAVEGHRFRVGVGTTPQWSKKVRLYGYAAYGLYDKKFKYGGEFHVNLENKPWSFIGGAFKNDVELSNENSEQIPEDNFLTGLYRRDVPWKLMKVLEAKMFYQKGLQNGWSLRGTILHTRMNPYGPEDGRTSDGRYMLPFKFTYPHAPGDGDTSSIRSTEFIFKARYAFKERFVQTAFNRRSLGSKFPIVEFQYTKGIKGLLGSQYDYHKIQLYMTHWFNIAPVGWMRYTVKAGKVFGDLPYLLLQPHAGNETYFNMRSAFNAMNRFEFVSDQYVELMLEHHMDGFFLNHIPLLRKLKWREVAVFKAAYGSLTDANRQNNAANNYVYDPSKSRLPEGSGVFYGTFDPYKPYMECSIGIENIFKVLRIDAVWRLNYVERNYDVNPFTLRGTIQFQF